MDSGENEEETAKSAPMDSGEKEEEDTETGATSRRQDIPSCSRSNRLYDDPGADSSKKEQAETTPFLTEHERRVIDAWIMDSRRFGVGSYEEPDDDPGSDSGKKEQMESITTLLAQRVKDSWEDTDDKPDKVRQDSPSCSRAKRICGDPGSDSGKEQMETITTTKPQLIGRFLQWFTDSPRKIEYSDDKPDVVRQDSPFRCRSKSVCSDPGMAGSFFCGGRHSSCTEGIDEILDPEHRACFPLGGVVLCSNCGECRCTGRGSVEPDFCSGFFTDHEGTSRKITNVRGSKKDWICSSCRCGYQNFAWREKCNNCHRRRRFESDAGPSMDNLNSLRSQAGQLNISASLGDMNDNRSTAHGRSRDGPREFGDGLPQPTHGERFPDEITQDGRSESQSPPRLPPPYHDREGTE